MLDNVRDFYVTQGLSPLSNETMASVEYRMLEHEPFPFATYASDHRSAGDRDAVLQVQTNTVTSSVAISAPHFTDEDKPGRKRQVDVILKAAIMMA